MFSPLAQNKNCSLSSGLDTRSFYDNAHLKAQLIIVIETTSFPSAQISVMAKTLVSSVRLGNNFSPPEPRSAKPQQKKRERKMGSRLGRRVVHFANLPIKLLMPSTFTNIREIALKTIPSASKIEIKRVLESLYGFDVDKVRTLNMEGKKKKRGGLLIAKPDYKKAYVTLRTPLSIPENVFPINVIQEEKQSINKNAKNKSLVEEGEKKKHWLDGKEKERENTGRVRDRSRRGQGSDLSRGGGEVKFPWSSMRRSS